MGEDKIKDAKVSEIIEENKKEKKTSWLSDFYVEAVLFLILGALIGFAVKTEAVKRVTMGFSDYKMKIFEKGYDINELEKQQIQKNLEEANAAENNQDEEAVQGITGGSCQ